MRNYNKVKIIPLKEINDNDEFWSGATFRKEGIPLNMPLPEENYYEYMLFLDQGNSDWMICAHVDKWEAGSVVAYIKMCKENNRFTVKLNDFKTSMVLLEEIDQWFFLEGGIRETRTKSKITNNLTK